MRPCVCVCVCVCLCRLSIKLHVYFFLLRPALTKVNTQAHSLSFLSFTYPLTFSFCYNFISIFSSYNFFLHTSLSPFYFLLLLSFTFFHFSFTYLFISRYFTLPLFSLCVAAQLCLPACFFFGCTFANVITVCTVAVVATTATTTH